MLPASLMLMLLIETLRRSSESTMHALVRTIFGRLHSLDPELEEAKLQINEEDQQEGEIKLTVSGSAALSEAPPSEERDEEANVAQKSAQDAEIPTISEKEAMPNEIAASQEDPLLVAPKPECEYSRLSPANSNIEITVCRRFACDH